MPWMAPAWREWDHTLPFLSSLFPGEKSRVPQRVGDARESIVFKPSKRSWELCFLPWCNVHFCALKQEECRSHFLSGLRSTDFHSPEYSKTVAWNCKVWAISALRLSCFSLGWICKFQSLYLFSGLFFLEDCDAPDNVTAQPAFQTSIFSQGCSAR